MNLRSLLAAASAALLLGTLASAQAPVPSAPPADAAALHQRSIELLQQKNAKEAVDLAEQATKADPTNPEYFSQLGVALSQRISEVNFMQMPAISGKMRKAFEKSVALDPNHLPGLIGLTRFYTNAPEIAGGSLEKAAEFAGRLRVINPFLGEVELGRIAEKNEDSAAALTHYEAASQLKPDNAGMQNACGRVLAALGRKDEARARYEAALKLNPEFEPAKKALAALDALPAEKP
jgi:Flp pilus assembly protein TadD